MTKRFQVISQYGHYRFGKNIKANGSTIEPGYVVKLDTGGSTASLCGSGETPEGFAFGERFEPYRPTSSVFADGEALTIVKARGLALISADFFTSGSLPTTVNTALYTAAGGTLGTSSGGETKIAKYIRNETLTVQTGGTGTTETLALIEFDFPV